MAVATPVLIVIPEMIGFEAFRQRVFDTVGVYFWDDPFPGLSYLGGIVGGYVAGYLTRDTWLVALTNGARATVLGMVLYYGISVLANGMLAVVTGTLSASVLLLIVFQPLLFQVLPLGLLYFFQSLVVSPFANLISKLLYSMVASETCSPSTETQEYVEISVRYLIPGLIFVLLFVAVWWFTFSIETQY